MARGKGYSAFLTAGGLVLSLGSHRGSDSLAAAKGSTFFLNLVGAAPNPVVEGENQQPGHLNYFMGKDSRNWHTNVPLFGQVRYKNVYPGIDLVFYGNHQRLEYDFEVGRGTNPNLIQFEIKGASNVEVDGEGNLLLKDKGNEIRFQNPLVYQVSNGQRIAVNGGYALRDATHVGFHVAEYDSNRPLVIDPVLAYCTYLGGSGDDEPQAIAIDSSGAIYVTGDTMSADFPGTSPSAFTGDNVFVAKLDPTGSTLVYADYIGGNGASTGTAIALDGTDEVYVAGSTNATDFPSVSAIQRSAAGNTDGFLTEVSSDGSALLFSTYLGGSDMDSPTGVAVDGSGAAYVAGWTMSTDFPVSSAYQTSASPNGGGQYGTYGFLSKVSSDKTALVYSTYLGGSGTVIQTCSGSPCWFEPGSYISGLALDASGNAYVTGITNTNDFPTTTGAYLTSYSNAQNMPVSFVAKFNTSGTIGYSTYLYGSGGNETNASAIAVDNTGSAYVTGATTSDGTFPITSTTICNPMLSGTGCNYAFVTKFNAAGTGLAYSTFLGLNNAALPAAIALDSLNDAYILSVTYTGSFGTVNGIESFTNSGSDLLLVEIDPLASAELFATYFGGTTAGAYAAGLAIDGSGDIYAGGVSSATDLPATLGAFQTASNGGDDAFLLKIQPGLSPAVAVSPAAMQYTSQQVGQSSQPRALVLRNMGSVPLAIASITTTGDFSQTNDCGSSISAAGSCNLMVSFVPQAGGTRSGSIVIEDNAAGSPHVIHLEGDAMGPMVSFSKSSVSFPSLVVDSTSAAQVLNLSNRGNAPLSISHLQVAGDFTQTNNCQASLASGATCQLQIVFRPTVAGVRSGTLTVKDDASNNVQSIALAGTGVDFSLASAQRNIQVSAGEAAKYALTVSPLGGAFSSAIQLSCSGLPAGMSCDLSQNTVTPGSSAASLVVTVNTASSKAASAGRNGWRSPYGTWIPLQGALALVGIVITGSNKKLRVRIFLPLIIGIILFASGCGGGQSASQLQNSPSATYNIKITGTSGALQHSIPLSLSIQ